MRFSDFDGLTFDMIGTLIDSRPARLPTFSQPACKTCCQLVAELSA